MADDLDDHLPTQMLAECRKGYRRSDRYAENGSHGVMYGVRGDSTKRDIFVVQFRIMNEQRAAKAAAEMAKREAEAKAAAQAAAEKVSNTKQVNRNSTDCSMASEISACHITRPITRRSWTLVSLTGGQVREEDDREDPSCPRHGPAAFTPQPPTKCLVRARAS